MEQIGASSTATDTVKTAIIVGLLCSLPLVLLLQVMWTQNVLRTTSLAIIEYEDGSVEAISAVSSERRDAVAGTGLVTLQFNEERRGWPTAGTIRYHPASIQISQIVAGGSLGGPVTPAQRRAITDALRQAGDDATLRAVEVATPIIERRGWGWAVNLLVCWLIAASGFQGIHGLIAHVRQTRGKLRAWEGQCPSCGYDLSGRPEGSQCSECGTVLPEPARQWAVRKSRHRADS